MTPAQQLEQDKRDADLRSVLSTEAGRRFFWRVLVVSKTFSQTFDLNDRASAFNDGQREVGLSLQREAQRVALDSYLKMTSERINAEVLEQQLRNESSHA